MKLHHKEEDIASKNKLFGSMEGKKSRYIYRIPYTANIFDVIFTVFNCVPISTVQFTVFFTVISTLTGN